MSIITTLSFQDLTGQHIKPIVTALQQIEKDIFELYQSHDSKPQVTKDRASQLAGPQDNTSQQDVDDVLNQLVL